MLSPNKYGLCALKERQAQAASGNGQRHPQKRTAAGPAASWPERFLPASGCEGEHQKRASRFAGQQPEDSEGRGDGSALLDSDAAQKPYSTDPDKLFQKLCGSGEPGLFPAQTGAGVAAVDGGQGNRGGHDLEQRFAAGFLQQVPGDERGFGPQKEPYGRGGQKGQKESCVEPGILFFFSGKRGETGDGGLHAGRSERMADGKNGEDQLIDSHTFRTESLGQEYLIEKAKKTAQQSGNGKDQRSFQKYGKLFHKKLFFLQYIRAECLTEPISDVIIKNEFRVKY